MDRHETRPVSEFVELLGVNIGAGLLEGAILRALGQEVP